ncbi:hypothetical protein LMG31886_01100 [Xanthomonas hydrangeae]|uniref:Cupin domain-containing protein n=1 Tax=Xanthomonas hydrangeae TaxID=2775159 RepID=A0AAU0BDW7_9XANT|nr:cupin domain-containing protein [Xanthomonas hydrangeae]WOB51268.1 cupin domain-containing protein [Xanthomonas hydrangeae]CAD7712459.1 hypothetical protein LMG31884_01090 [Xanthomonas hydrangeae]CAD7712460.1 hypothetical protein LMG31884_01090 [Xanthomonas hydrangeae]CAD7717493.1 hypothetical protein LMG31887_01090 [Xanthomonas hydrangeae]CAD7717495.1 hypothetical protein LMG31887_01090 [Xanthomonas hydrangeae]
MNELQASMANGFSVDAGEGERVWFVADTLIFKATAATTDGSYTVVECLTSPGNGPPPHIHTNEDEFWFVLDGTFEIHIGDAVHSVGPGGFAFGPRGIMHHFRNTASTPSRILLGFTPGGIEDFFRESGQPVTNDGPPPAVDAAEIARMKAAAARHGIVLASHD